MLDSTNTFDPPPLIRDFLYPYPFPWRSTQGVVRTASGRLVFALEDPYVAQVIVIMMNVLGRGHLTTAARELITAIYNYQDKIPIKLRFGNPELYEADREIEAKLSQLSMALDKILTSEIPQEHYD